MSVCKGIGRGCGGEQALKEHLRVLHSSLEGYIEQHSRTVEIYEMYVFSWELQSVVSQQQECCDMYMKFFYGDCKLKRMKWVTMKKFFHGAVNLNAWNGSPWIIFSMVTVNLNTWHCAPGIMFSMVTRQVTYNSITPACIHPSSQKLNNIMVWSGYRCLLVWLTHAGDLCSQIWDISAQRGNHIVA